MRRNQDPGAQVCVLLLNCGKFIDGDHIGYGVNPDDKVEAALVNKPRDARYEMAGQIQQTNNQCDDNCTAKY